MGARSILLACDLDNTLIHSYKRMSEGDVCVEYWDGKPLSYMSPSALSLLNDIGGRIMFVPVTSRSMEQYSRIMWQNMIRHEYAITTNGGILMLNGAASKPWASDMQCMVTVAHDELMFAQSLLQSDKSCIKVRFIDNIYIFAWSDEPEKTKHKIDAQLDSGRVLTARQGNKIYVFPKGLSKGAALKKLVEQVKPDYLICAGDNALDISMLEIADLAIIPLELFAKRFKCANTVVYDYSSSTFAEYILIKTLNVLCKSLTYE